jgi:hypothetical protein
MALNLCGLIGDNTGPVPCDITRGVPKFPFIGGKVFQPNDYATQTAFQTAFKAAAKLPNGNTSKLFPFPEIQGNTDKTDANKEGTLGYGFKQVLLEGRPAYEFDVLIGQTQFQKLRKFNRTIAPVFISDDANNMWGVYKSDGTFVGNDAYIFVTGNTFGDGSKNIVAKITFSFVSVGDFHDSSAYFPLNFNPNEVKGLLDVVLTEAAAHSTNVYHIAADVLTAKLGTKINVAGTFGTELASAALWTLVKDSDGTSVTITSVALNAGGTYFDFTIDSTAYTALASGAKLRIGLATPATLDTAGATGIEAPDYLIITKP